MTQTPNAASSSSTPGQQPQQHQHAQSTNSTTPATDLDRIRFALVGFIAGAATIGLAWSIATRGNASPGFTPAQNHFQSTTIEPRTYTDTTTNADPSFTDISASSTPSSAAIIDINTADRETLDLLPGIGPAMAERIVNDRLIHGPFETIDDLQRVHGIGPRTVNNIRHLVTITHTNNQTDNPTNPEEAPTP